MLHKLLVEQHRRLGVVRLDAPHVVGLLAVDGLHQRQHGVLEESSSRQWSLGGLGDMVGSLRPHRLQILVTRVEEKPFEILKRQQLKYFLW